jgi:hypothetical protein
MMTEAQRIVDYWNRGNKIMAITGNTDAATLFNDGSAMKWDRQSSTFIVVTNEGHTVRPIVIIADFGTDWRAARDY